MKRTFIKYILVIAVICLSSCSNDQSSKSFGPTDSQITSAKNKYRKTHIRCELCNARSNISNGNKNDIHHRIPVHIDRSKAADQDNLITLCRRHHFYIGHMGNWKSHNSNLDETIDAMKKAYELHAIKEN